jgi:hypothetical protein
MTTSPRQAAIHDGSNQAKQLFSVGKKCYSITVEVAMRETIKKTITDGHLPSGHAF